MDLELDEAQVELRDTFRRQLAAHCDPDTRRAAIDQPGAVDRKLWQRLADVGVFGVTVAESNGGLGAGAAEAVVVHEEIGRAAVPGPVVATAVVAARVPGALDGSVVVSAAFERDPFRIVEHLDGCDLVAVFAPERTLLMSREAVQAGFLPMPLDPLTPLHQLVGNWPSGDVLESGDLWWRGTLYTAATSVRLAAAAIDVAAAYSLERQQFGRPIGSFQAIKHLLADALAASEIARSAVYSAAVTHDEAGMSTDTRIAIAYARILASKAAKVATRACVQVHGGMGYTWELDAHLFLKRALVLDTHFESPDGCRTLITERVRTV